MEATGFADPDGDTHACSDWQISSASTAEPVWKAPCAGGQESVHIHLGDGVFVNSHAGRSELKFDTDYRLRVRFQDGAGEVSSWSERSFKTSPEGPSGEPGAVPWAVKELGYEVEVVASGLQLPVNVAPVPQPESQPDAPFLYITELYGDIKVLTRDGTLRNYATGLLNFNPTGNFPGSGEQGVTGIVVDPVSGDLFVSMVYRDSASTASPKPHYPKVVRFHSNDGGLTAASQTTVLDMSGETQGASHQISNLTIGPDGALYVHNGDGFDPTTAQKLGSFRGKVLRMNLDGSAPQGNPFYDSSNGITARDYVFASGFRNPFGGAWRASDESHYEVENGPSVDRFAKVVSGRNYLWDGSDASMRNFALYNWDPGHAPVNIAFVEPQTASGSGFPAEKMDHAFVTLSGATWATGPQSGAKRIVEFVPDEAGEFGASPTTLVKYTGTGKATAAGLAAGSDGLYFTDLYKDLHYTSAVDRGANLLRVRYVGAVTAFPSGTTIVNGSFRSGTATRLRADNGSYYEVNSTTSGTRRSSWYGRFTGVPNGLRDLSLTYKGKNSRTCTQTVSIWRWTTSSWVRLDSRSVGDTEAQIDETPTGTLANYVSGDSGEGELRLRVRCTRSSSSFHSSGDPDEHRLREPLTGPGALRPYHGNDGRWEPLGSGHLPPLVGSDPGRRAS